MKAHSFIQHFPLFLLPGTLWKNYKTITTELITFLAGEFQKLFEVGFDVEGTNYRAVVVGSKGDLKWVSKIGRLVRGHERQGRVRDLAMCHLCLAGQNRQLAFEDITKNPGWEPTLHVERPWLPTEPSTLLQIPFDPAKPEWIFRNDCFHNLRLGVYRDFTASIIFLWLRWGYFGRTGAIPDKLIAAHGHFSLWLTTTTESVALRSFSTLLFNYKNASSYVWANVKGSDVMLLLKWISTACVGFMFEETDPEKRQVMSIILSSSRLAVDFFDIVYQHGLFLEPPCAANLYERGQGFLQGYSWLASYCAANKRCLFGLKPKLHFHKHVLLELFHQLQNGSTRILSPVMWDCSQNEDLMGRICRLGRRVDSRVLTQKTLEFYLVKAAILLRRHMNKHLDLDALHVGRKRSEKGKGTWPTTLSWFLHPQTYFFETAEVEVESEKYCFLKWER